MQRQRGGETWRRREGGAAAETREASGGSEGGATESESKKRREGGGGAGVRRLRLRLVIRVWDWRPRCSGLVRWTTVTPCQCGSREEEEGGLALILLLCEVCDCA